MFSPAGHVDSVHINETRLPTNEMIYFCVGDWDRQIRDGVTSAEDGKSNLEVSATYWITLHPKTGGVRIAENFPVKGPINFQDTEPLKESLREARKFAREHFYNVGER